MLGNLLAVASALGLPAKVICGFVDDGVNALLDVDTQREVAFSLVALGYNPDYPPSAAKLPLRYYLSDWRLSRFPGARLTIPSCEKCMLPLRYIRPTRLPRGERSSSTEQFRTATERASGSAPSTI